MAIIIPTSCPSPHQLSPHPSSPIPPPVFSGPLSNPQRSAFLFPSVRFFVSSNLLSRPLRSASSFPLFRIFVSLFRSFVFFGPFLSFFRSALSFSSVCFLVSFGLLFRFLWSVSTRHCFVARSFPSSSFLSFCQVFSSLSNPTHVFQRWRPCPSTFETTPFLRQEHALQRSRTRPSSPVSVYAWFRVSCRLGFAPCCSPCVGIFVCILVKFFHKPKRLVGCFVSHRFSQMNRSLSAHRGSTQRRTGPSPVPSPKGRGVITEIPLWLIINT